MSSTILYKFRIAATFEALPLPGSAARLFDVKKAIVSSKKLDQAGTMDFELSVQDATTNEEYTDENMLLPRGTRLLIQRLPAAKGHGFLSRMQRHPYGGGAPGQPQHGAGTAPNANFYTIDSRAHGDDDEFVSTTAPPPQEDQELLALRAATDAANQASRNTGIIRPGNQNNFRHNVAGQGPPSSGPLGGGRGGNYAPRQRPNADPELREQEKQMMPKKRATGIPRTFLNLKAPPQTSESGLDSEGNTVPLLQPNTIGFEELVHRGGGQSENATGTQRNLDYAIKLTATTVPEYLQCAICNNVVRDAMILPWDPEGRTTCESCIRDSLTQNGFRCPLTGQEGVSPDDLLPNHALRKAAEQFVKGVMEKMEEIEKQQVDDDYDDGIAAENKEVAALDGEEGVIISKRTSITDRKKKEEDDPFGSDDVFGGDVFAVDVETERAEQDATESKEEKTQTSNRLEEVKKKKEVDSPQHEKNQITSTTKTDSKDHDSAEVENPPKPARSSRSFSPAPLTNRTDNSPSDAHQGPRREARRGIPVGYKTGPAGARENTSFSPRTDEPSHNHRKYDAGFRSHGAPRQDSRRGNHDRYNHKDKDATDPNNIDSNHFRNGGRSRHEEELPQRSHRRDESCGNRPRNAGREENNHVPNDFNSDQFRNGGRSRHEEELSQRSHRRDEGYGSKPRNVSGEKNDHVGYRRRGASNEQDNQGGAYDEESRRLTKRSRNDADSQEGRSDDRYGSRDYGAGASGGYRDHGGGRGTGRGFLRPVENFRGAAVRGRGINNNNFHGNGGGRFDDRSGMRGGRGFRGGFNGGRGRGRGRY